MPLNDPLRSATLRLHKAQSLLVQADAVIVRMKRRWVAAIVLAISLAVLAVWGWLRCR